MSNPFELDAEAEAAANDAEALAGLSAVVKETKMEAKTTTYHVNVVTVSGEWQVVTRYSEVEKLLGALKKGPDEVRERVGSPAVQLWEASHFPYVVIWGTWGWSGGLTVQALDLQNLLAEGLPAVVARTLEKGGLCTFLPGVDDAVLDQVLGRIAELQPSTGSA